MCYWVAVNSIICVTGMNQGGWCNYNFSVAIFCKRVENKHSILADYISEEKFRKDQLIYNSEEKEFNCLNMC